MERTVRDLVSWPRPSGPSRARASTTSRSGSTRRPPPASRR